jgi:hypothetical protein
MRILNERFEEILDHDKDLKVVPDGMDVETSTSLAGRRYAIPKSMPGALDPV